MRSVSILGCGWLGLPLAKDLINSGYEVKGSTTSHQKLSILKSEKIIPFQITLNPDVESDDLNSFFECDYLIINIPPPTNPNPEEFHLKQIQSVINEFQKAQCRKVVFVSSTSVYGSTNSEIDEDSPVNPETDSGKVLVQVEDYLRTESDFKITIIRFGGLIGEDRNPARYFAGRKKIPGGNTPVNLIHQKDCIGIIKSVINNEIWNETINGVSLYHPTKKDFYTKAAAKLKLDLPEFDAEIVPYKIILSKKVEELLNYNFIYPDPFMMI